MSNSQDSGRRVVITGLGVVSPIGIGVDRFWESLSTGRSGISRIQLFPDSAVPHHIGGEVRDFNDKTAKDYIKQKKSIKVMCREIQLGVASASLAIDHAGIAEGQLDPERLGVDFGANLMLSPPVVLADSCFTCSDPETHKFHYPEWGTKGLGSMQPLWLLQYLPNMPACHIGISADARGPNNSITMAEASGNMAVGEALRIISRGSADVMITGTTGTTLHPVKSLHAALWDVLANEEGDPARACRPFDLNRTGQVVAEGACTFILESEEHARGRGAKILGTVLGAGSTCVLDREGRPDNRRALVQAMRQALNDAGLQPQDVGHINAHGLGTPEADRIEAQAILDLFGEYGKRVPVTAMKSYLGNPGSSCGTLELAGSLVGLMHGIVPPTLNYETPDPACPLNIVAGKPLEVDNRIVLKVNVTRVGQASAVVIRVA
jgi:3-oxoacyl-[acyl-carrier-protein] synthase II